MARSMVIGKAAWRERGNLSLEIELARQAAERFLTKTGTAAFIEFEPEVSVLRDLMDSARKGATFVATIVNGGLQVDTYVGSQRAPISTYTKGPGNPEAYLAWMKLLRKHSTLVTDAEIKVLEAGSTREADVAKLKAQKAAVEKQAAVIAQQIKKLQAALKPKTDEIERLNKSLAKFGE